MVKTAVMESVIRENSEVMDRVLKNALGVVVSNNETGIPAHSTYDNSLSMGILKHINCLLVSAARSAIRDIDSENDLIYLRIATRKFEYLVGPEEEFTVVVIQ